MLPALVKFGRWRGRLTFVSDEGPLPMSAVMVAHRDTAGDIVQVTLVARDLDELRDAEERVSGHRDPAGGAGRERRRPHRRGRSRRHHPLPQPGGQPDPRPRRRASSTGADLLALVHPDDVPTDLLALAQPDEQGIGSPVVLRVRTSDGSWRHLEVIVTDLTQNPAIGGLVLNARDVTERVVAARQLADRAFTDPLTDLPNRVRLYDRLTHDPGPGVRIGAGGRAGVRHRPVQGAQHAGRRGRWRHACCAGGRPPARRRSASR